MDLHSRDDRIYVHRVMTLHDVITTAAVAYSLIHTFVYLFLGH